MADGKTGRRKGIAFALAGALAFALIALCAVAPRAYAAETTYPVNIYIANPGTGNLPSHPSLEMTGAGPNAVVRDGGATGGYNAILTLKSAADIDKLVIPKPHWYYAGEGVPESWRPYRFACRPSGGSITGYFDTEQEVAAFVQKSIADGTVPAPDGTEIHANYWFDIEYGTTTAFYYPVKDPDTGKKIAQLLTRIECKFGEYPAPSQIPASAPSFDKSEFAGWITYAGNNEWKPYTGDWSQWAAFVRVYAAYNPIVTFDPAGGVLADEQDAEQVVVAGQKAVRPTDPSREGFEFAAWVDPEGAAYDFETPVNAPLALKATWRLLPQGQNVTVAQGDPVPDAKDGIANAGDLPEGTGFAWKSDPSTDTAGTTRQIVVVTYPDGTVHEVEVQVEVTARPADPTQPGDTQPLPDAKTAPGSKTVPGPQATTPQTGDAPLSAVPLAGAAVAAVCLARLARRKAE